jgi:molecular chaperone DnaK (HSP70)
MCDINNICIDFGTSNTVISYIEDNKIKQLQDSFTGDSLISTCIYLNDSVFENKKKPCDFVPFVDYIIGNEARQLSNKDNSLYFYEFKRFLGISKKTEKIYKDFLNRYTFDYELEYDLMYFIINKDGHELKISVIELTRLYFIALFDLLKIKFNIIGNIKTILTCPAYFNDSQRNQLKLGVDKSGFEIYKIFNEPTAAVIYYIDYVNNKKKEQSNTFSNLEEITKNIIESGDNTYIVYDIGGGTIDVTAVTYMNDDNICEVIDIDGNSSLGGIDIDELLKEHIYSKYHIDYDNKKWKNKMKRIAEDIKIKLSFNIKYDMILEDVPIKKSVTSGTEIIEELKIMITRQEFNNLIENLVSEMLEPFERIYKKYNTNNIVLIGGPHKIPLINNKINIITENNAIIIDDKDNSNANIYKTIVSEGGSLLYNYIQKESLYILDIVPMNIGVCDGDNEMVVMIEKNKKIPITIEKTFTTNYDCQRVINVEIYEGNNESCEQNIIIGSYQIFGIPPQPKGTILIKLKFVVNNNGILGITVSGKEGINNETGRGGVFKIEDKIKILPMSIRDSLLKKILTRNKK